MLLATYPTFSLVTISISKILKLEVEVEYPLTACYCDSACVEKVNMILLSQHYRLLFRYANI